MPGLAQSVLNYGRGALSSARGLSGSARLGIGRALANPWAYRTGIGAAAGGIYGGLSNDTSVIGGALMGAGIARYGGAGISQMAQFSGRGLNFRGHLGGFMRAGLAGMWGKGKVDAMRFARRARGATNYLGARLRSNFPVR